MLTNDVKVLSTGNATLRLNGALLFYSSGPSHIYATVHEVVAHPTIEGARMIGPGRPATKAALAAFAARIDGATGFAGMVPAELLYTAPNIIAWWCPAAVRRVWFRTGDSQIGEASAEVLHPPLVFVATQESWYVYAVAGTERPDAATPLYKAPYFNVWENGEICTGNVDLPAAVGPASIAAYEDAFFRSRFTHSNDRKLVKFKGGATALWRAQLANPEQQLLAPPHLLARKETLEQAITRIQKEAQR